LTRRGRGAQTIADWLTLLAGLGLFGSLLLAWSHQLRRGTLSIVGGSPALRGVPRDPTAWQVYSLADVLLALLAAALVLAALAAQSRRVRAGLLVAVALALAFALHALSVPPTNGVLLIDPTTGRYLVPAATAGAGETMAIASLGVAAVGLALALAAA
jgi:hypothetical protein